MTTLILTTSHLLAAALGALGALAAVWLTRSEVEPPPAIPVGRFDPIGEPPLLAIDPGAVRIAGEVQAYDWSTETEWAGLNDTPEVM